MPDKHSTSSTQRTTTTAHPPHPARRTHAHTTAQRTGRNKTARTMHAPPPPPPPPDRQQQNRTGRGQNKQKKTDRHTHTHYYIISNPPVPTALPHATPQPHVIYTMFMNNRQHAHTTHTHTQSHTRAYTYPHTHTTERQDKVSAAAGGEQCIVRERDSRNSQCHDDMPSSSIGDRGTASNCAAENWRRVPRSSYGAGEC